MGGYIPWLVGGSKAPVRYPSRRRTVRGGCRSGKQVPWRDDCVDRAAVCRPDPAERSTDRGPCTTPRLELVASSTRTSSRLPPSFTSSHSLTKPSPLQRWLINSSAYRPAIGPIDIENTRSCTLTSYVLRLFAVANGVGSVQKVIKLGFRVRVSCWVI